MFDKLVTVLYRWWLVLCQLITVTFLLFTLQQTPYGKANAAPIHKNLRIKQQRKPAWVKTKLFA